MIRRSAANACSSNSRLLWRTVGEQRTSPTREIAIRSLDRISTRIPDPTTVPNPRQSWISALARRSYVELCPHERVIRRANSAARFDVHVDLLATQRQGLRRQNMVEPPAFVLIERTRP